MSGLRETHGQYIKGSPWEWSWYYFNLNLYCIDYFKYIPVSIKDKIDKITMHSVHTLVLFWNENGKVIAMSGDSCWCMAKPIQYCKVISLQLK